MAKELPARGSWPGLVPETELRPGLPHLDVHAEKAAKEQHYLMAYQGRGHVGQWWPAASVRVDTTVSAIGTRITVLRYLIRPRLGAKGLRWLTTAISDGVAKIHVYTVTDATRTTITLAGTGALEYDESEDATFVHPESWQVVNVELELDGAGAATYVDLRSLSLYDRDLAVADL